MQRRRAVVGLSLLGMSAMAATSLLQTGILKHLPDPPVPGFNSDKVNLSATAYPFGITDGTLALASCALNLPLAAFGDTNRAVRQPLVSLLATAKGAADALVAGWFFYQMPAREKAWCGYCVTAALASFMILLLSLPEAKQALAALARRPTGRDRARSAEQGSPGVGCGGR